MLPLNSMEDEENDVIVHKNKPSIVKKIRDDSDDDEILDDSDNFMLTQAERKILKLWLPKHTFPQIEKKSVFEKRNFSLVYKATRDGFSAKNFHQKCDKLGKPTICIIMSRNGAKFGGFFSISSF